MRTNANSTSRPVRRTPKQRRSRALVDAVLDSATKILMTEGATAITTNRISAVAGVSIGSVYQYFPDKRAIFEALHDRHVEQMCDVVESRLSEQVASSPAAAIRDLTVTLIDAHMRDARLCDLLARELAHTATTSTAVAGRLVAVVRDLLMRTLGGDRASGEVAQISFIVWEMIDAFAHGVILRRPLRLSPETAKSAAVQALSGYLESVL